MKLALVGSRNFTNYDQFKQAVCKVLDQWDLTIEDVECIVSGGARGADSLAERFAKEHDIQTNIFRVTSNDWKKYGKSAGILRNTSIVDNSTHMIAFPSRSGRGTQDSINKARSKGLRIQILYID